MDILDMIREDHDEALNLIKKLDKLSEEAPTAKVERTVRELVIAVKLHAKSEEVALYAGIQAAKRDFRDFVLEAYNEHELLDHMLDKLLLLEAGEDGELKAALSVCKDLIEHHGKEEEEKELFPKLKKFFSAEELMGMGNQMQNEKERLRSGIEAQVDTIEPGDDGGDMPRARGEGTKRSDRTVSH
jgi:hemerythrin-like domain-containing protein